MKLEQSAAPLPATFASGRYKVERALGEGARKKVYLALDTRLDRQVAVSEIKSEGLDDGGRTRIRRETQAMARLGDHPNIVTIHDVFEESGTVYIVSQLMGGGSLEELLKVSDEGRLEIDPALALARQIASALAHAHSRGIVHRDVKPANVWLAEDGTAKLGDFGLAVASEHSRITSEGMIVGTVAYIAPEQALGQPPHPRSDLYSLGALIYETLTGRPPFLGDDAVAVIGQHISTAPVGPSWHNRDVPPAVESLVLRLLAKDPEARPATAEEVISAIDHISARPVELADRVAHEEANPLDRLASGVFVGRDREMAELKQYVDDALSGHPRLLMLVGEPGIGKTRTSEEISTYARLRGAQVLVGRCYEGEGAPAYWPWIQLIRSYVHDRPVDALLSELGSGASNIAQIVSEVREKLPGLPKPQQLDPEEARFRLFDSIASFLRNASKAQPLLLVMDDLHWADKPSLLLLQFLARELQGSRVLGLGTYRDVELGRHHPLARTLAELAGEDVVRRILLRGLSEEDVSRFIELSSGIKPDPTLVAAVFRETEGNPFFVAETVRLLVSEGRLQHQSGTSSWSVTIPQGVRDVIGRRLNRLSDDANTVLSIASVVGRDFSLNILERAAEMEKDRLLEVLEEAVEARLIGEAEGVGRYRFSHALIPETLYEDLSTTRRIRMHRKIGAILESIYGSSPERHLPELAYHFFEAAAAGEVEKALLYNQRAAERAMSLTAYEEAVQLYDRALQVQELKDAPEQALVAELLLGMGMAQTSAGETIQARETLARAAELAKTLGLYELYAEAALGAGDVWVSAGWFEDDLIKLLEDALSKLPEEDSKWRALLMGRLDEALRFTSRKDERNYSSEALEMARRLNDPEILTQTLFWRVIALGAPKDREERWLRTEELIQVARANNDTKRELLGLRISVPLAIELGRFEEAAAAVEKYGPLAERTRLPLYTWFTPLLKAGLAVSAGEFDRGTALLEEGRALGAKAGEPNLEPFTLWILVMLRRYQGRLSEVKAKIKASRTSLPQWVVTTNAFLAASTGDLESAKRDLGKFEKDDFREVPEDWMRLWMLADLAEVCWMVESESAAPKLYDLLLPNSDVFVFLFPAGCRGPVERSLGQLAAVMGKFEDAESHFANAVDLARRAGSPPMEAEIHRDIAEMLMRRDAPGDHERALAAADAALAIARELGMLGVVESVLSLRLARQAELSGSLTDVGGSLHAVASAVEEEKPDLVRHASPDGTVTLLFSDIENSTALNESVGDDKWLEILRAHNSIIRRELTNFGGYEVKSAGDGFMLAFSSARQGLGCAIAIQKSLRKYDESNPAVPIRVRMGLHTGEATREAGDFFGRHVNLAARVAGEAVGGEILVSSLTRALVSGTGQFTFGEEREVSLKGLSEPQRVSPLIWD